MILKMKRVYLLMPSAEVDPGLNKLQALGLVHIIQEDHSRRTSDLIEIEKNMAQIKKALAILPPEKKSSVDLEVRKQDVLDLSAKIISLGEELDRLTSIQNELDRHREKLAPWGDFAPQDLNYLRENGINIHFLILSKNFLAKAGEIKNLFQVNRQGKNAHYMIFIGESIPEFLKESVVQLPEYSLSDIDRKIDNNKNQIKEITAKIEELNNQRAHLEHGLAALGGEEDYASRRAGIWKNEELSYLSGFICARDIDQLKSAAGEHSWGLLIRDPLEDEEVPTITTNPKWIRIIQPVLNILDTIPGYREFDISLWFLLFFTLFSAMIIGDAGYGFIFLFITFLAKKKSRGKNKEVFSLLFVLSSATIVWGTMTGTWFGSEALANLALFKVFRIEAISSFNINSGELIKKITFIIGVIHLSIAHLKSFIRQFPSLKAYTQIGWWAIVIGLYFMVLNVVIDEKKYPISNIHLGIVLAGILLVIVFAEQQDNRNFFKGLAMGLLTLPLKFLNFVSAFADIISYVRLFAVGLATFEIARNFNTMTANMATGPVGIILMIILLLLGHSLNLAMSVLAVMVHAIRLKMLEFSGHLGMEWKGNAFKPFKKNKIMFKKEQ